MGLRIGRFDSDTFRSPAEVAEEGRNLSASGVIRGVTGDTARRLKGELLAMVGQVVPVVWTRDSTVDGWWRLDSVEVAPRIVTDDTFTVGWSVGAVRRGRPGEVEFESRRAGAIVPNDHALAGERWHAPPVGASGYSTGASAPSKVVRTADGGLGVDVYRGLPDDVDPIWGATPDGFYAAAAQLLSAGLPVGGVDVVADLAASWTLDNGLIRVSKSADATATLDVEHFTGGAWHTKTYDVQQDGNTITDLLAVTVKRNDPSEVVVRLLADPAGGAIGRTVLDLSLRRGARHLSCLLQRHAAATLKVQRHTAEAATDIAGGIRATNDDADGDRYIIASSKTVAKGLTQGSISKTAVTLFDFAIGVEADGSLAQAGDVAADVINQYLDGTDTVDVPVVR